MKWDVKIALYLFLAYSLYGVTYLFTNGDYVVPLPIFFILIPIVSLVLFVTSGFNKYSIFFILLPLGVMSDKIREISYFVSDLVVIIGIFSWFTLGLLILLDNKYRNQILSNKILWLPPILYVLSPLAIFLNEITLFFLPFSILMALIVRNDGEKYALPMSVRRLFILSAFISWMFLITSLSVYLSS